MAVGEEKPARATMHRYFSCMRGPYDACGQGPTHDDTIGIESGIAAGIRKCLKGSIMTNPLKEALADPEVLVSLAPEELASVLLPILKNRDGPLSGYGFVKELYQPRKVYADAHVDHIASAITEAWSWMITVGLLAPDPQHLPGGDWVFLTRRASKIADQKDFQTFRKATAFPRSLLHPVLTDRAWPNSIRGEQSSATSRIDCSISLLPVLVSLLPSGGDAVEALDRAYAGSALRSI
jgi:hypothetical protein